MAQRVRCTALGLVVLVASLVAEMIPAQGLTPWSTTGWPLSQPLYSMPGYSYWPYSSYSLLNRYPGDRYSGVNPLRGYGITSPRSFLYQYPTLPGGPYGYIQGWVTPQGDFEGTMVIRGNMRKLMGNYYNNWLYNYYLNNY
jgi:hypothetical protein